MTNLQAVVLGLVQGLTEFLPVSSSGHLIVVPRLLGWAEQPLSFDVALHLGTMLAVLLYFARDFSALIRGGLSGIIRHRLRFGQYPATGRLALLIVLGSLPAVIAGGTLATWIEEHVRNAGLVAVLLVVFGLVLLAAERWAPSAAGLDAVNTRRALLIGGAQAVALIPGVSRSGFTIATGMFTGLSREAATRFSFLLAAPVTVGAGVKELPALRDRARDGVSILQLGIGFTVAFLVGLATVHLLLRYVARRPLSVFVWYRIGVAALTIAALGF